MGSQFRIARSPACATTCPKWFAKLLTSSLTTVTVNASYDFHIISLFCIFVYFLFFFWILQWRNGLFRLKLLWSLFKNNCFLNSHLIPVLHYKIVWHNILQTATFSIRAIITVLSEVSHLFPARKQVNSSRELVVILANIILTHRMGSVKRSGSLEGFQQSWPFSKV